MDVETFRAALETKIQARCKASGSTAAFIPNIVLERGPKYTRVIRSIVIDGKPVERSAYGFIRNEDGALLKSDGWKRPAKGTRGNLSDADPLARCDEFSIR